MDVRIQGDHVHTCKLSILAVYGGARGGGLRGERPGVGCVVAGWVAMNSFGPPHPAPRFPRAPLAESSTEGPTLFHSVLARPCLFVASQQAGNPVRGTLVRAPRTRAYAAVGFFVARRTQSTRRDLRGYWGLVGSCAVDGFFKSRTQSRQAAKKMRRRNVLHRLAVAFAP